MKKNVSKEEHGHKKMQHKKKKTAGHGMKYSKEDLHGAHMHMMKNKY
jgi:hypothetical protein